MKKKIISLITTLALCLTMAVPAFAATSADTDVYGHINEVTVGPTPSYDVTMSTSVHWWVTKALPNDVQSGDAVGVTTSTTPNTIANNNTTDPIYVTFESFTAVPGDAATVAGDLVLNLLGDLANDGVGAFNLNNGYSGTAVAYSSALGAGATWVYGFGGTYTPAAGTYPTTALNPQYTMTLSFSY